MYSRMPSAPYSSIFFHPYCHTRTLIPCLSPLLPQVERVLATSYNWQFDAFRLAEATGDRALSTLGFFLFNEADLIKQFALRPVQLVR